MSLLDSTSSSTSANKPPSVTAITIIRINVLLHVDFTDLSYSMHDAAFWSVAEPAIAIINCCIATLRPLLKLISPARLWSSQKSNTADRAGYSVTKEASSGSRLKRKLGLDGMHDEYPLTRIEDGINNTTVFAGGREDGGVTKGDAESDSSLKGVTALPSGNGWPLQHEQRPGMGTRSNSRNKDHGVIHVQTEYRIEGQRS